ncbi:AAA family ATPase [Butyrivibrio sp. AE2005]|uniref:AAA family ATPase n=1 Tax=Butyrivibrio sp. AE2005 TaxID=1496722 RepID=UPI00047A5D08|nr:AAA family ATPase [Butyrivibrio sp. AE2005]
MVQIKKIKVVNLFDYYCYEIKMNSHSNISIIHAPNGYGKTTVFNLVKHYLDFDVYKIHLIPFEKFTIELTNKMSLVVEKNDNGEMHFVISESEKKVDCNIDYRFFCQVYSRSKNVKEYTQRIHNLLRRPHPEIVDFEKIHNQCQENLAVIDKLKELYKNLSLNIINSNRLFINEPSHDPYGNKYVNNKMYFLPDEYIEEDLSGNNRKEVIISDADNILTKMQNARQKYSIISESIDRNFPNRLVECVEDKNYLPYNDSEIKDKLKSLEEKRLELQNAGLLQPGKNTLTPAGDIDDTMRKFYTLYINDSFRKLKLYDDIKSKLELFIDIINTKTAFSNKKMVIDTQKGVFFEPIQSKTGKKHDIPLEKLSSGEKHDFIMFYELIFNSKKNSIVLIDEPEISLHVAWQMQFINILERICVLNNIQVIVATHSPDIATGHEDLLISLGLEEDLND